MLEDFTRGEMFIIKWQYRLETSHFMLALTKAMTLADEENLDRLARGWPKEVQALRAYRHVDGWWKTLEQRWHTRDG